MLAILFGAQVAQSVEQRTENPRVGGSIPSLGTTNIKASQIFLRGLFYCLKDWKCNYVCLYPPLNDNLHYPDQSSHAQLMLLASLTPPLYSAPQLPPPAFSVAP